MSNDNNADINTGKNTGKNPDSQDHWLVRPGTIRRLWKVFIVILLITVFAQYFVHVHGYFVVDEAPAFYAFFGFFSCLAMVVAAKLLGLLLKRKETFYDES